MTAPAGAAGQLHADSGNATLRSNIIQTARSMNALGINRGTAGNVSARCGGGLLITPSGLPYERIGLTDLVEMGLDGTVIAGTKRPSSEWHFHCEIYRARSDVAAIVHTHAPFATTLACLRRGVPAFHYMVAKAGGPDIRCAPYATFGTQALADNAVAALHARKACLLAHHGMIAVGATLEDALALAVDVEYLAEVYWRILQAGNPTVLEESEMDRVLARFATYGQQPSQDRDG